MEDFGIFYWQCRLFYGHLVYIVAIWYILWPFGIFTAIWYILWLFGIFFPFCYVVPIKIWQPCFRVLKQMF
jgi:hypothetical protein